MSDTEHSSVPACDRKINLMIAIAGLGIGGAEVVVQRIAESIDRRRFNLTICCIKGLGLIGEAVSKAGTDVVVLSGADCRGVNYLSFRSMLRLIRQKRIDVIHTHTTDALADAAVCRLFRPRLKLLHTFHFGNYPHRPRTELWMDRIFSRFAHRLFAVGEGQRATLKAVFGFSDARIGYVRNGVALPEGVADHTFADRYRPATGLLIGAIGTLIEQKGLFDLLEVAHQINLLRPEVRFVIAGEGRLRQQLEARRHDLGLDGVVAITGWISDAASTALPAFDIYFQPSLWEAMSIALLEAMAAARPIVATDVGEARFVVEDGTEALLVKPGDIQSMVRALLALIDDPALRVRLANAASSKARQRFTVEHMTRAYEDVYASLVARY